MNSLKRYWQELVVFIIFIILGFALPVRFRFILLGTSLLFFSPFIVMERYMIPLFRRYPKFSVIAAMLVAFCGGLVLDIGFDMS